MTIDPVRLNHAVLFVADLERSLRFYTDVFGMAVAAREPGAGVRTAGAPARGSAGTAGEGR